MKVPARWLRDLVDFTDPVAVLASQLSIAGLEVESVDELPDGELVLDVDVLPNMARCLSMHGVAREVAAVTESPLRLDPDLAELPDPRHEFAPQPVEPSLCGRFAALVIDDVDTGDAPSWMRERLIAAGVDSVGGLVDVANYVMIETGQPLHVYDLDRLGSPRLGVRASASGDALQLLGQPESSPPREIPAGLPVVVDERDQPVAVGGVVGGRRTAVGASTRSVVVEAASFDFISVRRTQTALGLVTEASARFSRGVDAELVSAGLGRFCALLREVSPRFRVRGLGETRTREPTGRTIGLEVEDLNRSVGATYEPDEVVAILGRLGLSASREGERISVHVGDERADLLGAHDLMEEVVRINGLDRLPATMPEDPIPPPVRDTARESRVAIREAMVRAGLHEVITYTLTSPAAHVAVSGNDNDELLSLLNPLSSDLTVTRRSLLPGLLETAEENLRHSGFVHVFEQGVVVLPEQEGSDRGLPREEQRVAFVVCGDAEPEGLWSDTSRALDFADAADIVAGLTEHLHVEGIRLAPAQVAPYLSSECAAVMNNETTLGYLGAVREEVAKSFGVTGRRVFAGELDADVLSRERRSAFTVRMPSRYPSVLLDLSVAVPAHVSVGDLVHEASAAAGAELTEVSVFDVFNGPGLSAETKAVGLRMTINAGDRTLTTGEAENVRERAVTRLRDVYAAERR